MDKEALGGTLDRIYDARSKLVHEGVRFPMSIVFGHYSKIPTEVGLYTFGEIVSRKRSGEVFLDVPSFLSFERLVSYTLVEFLRK